MSLEAWGDEGDVPTNGKDTAIYQELAPIYSAYCKWLIKYGKEFAGPDEEKLAGEVDQKLCQLSDWLAEWKP